ncbi:MAG: hypothetical protein RLZ25_542 [Pseudomonadota bacterium]|jgi:23S rRNA (cytidine2498-2'-O)-methyltransferase
METTERSLDTTGLLLYTRPGFEREAAAEIMDQVAALGLYGYVRTREGEGAVRFVPGDAGFMDILAKELRFHDLIFARQMVRVLDVLPELSTEDRLGPILASLMAEGRRYGDLMLETADTNDAKSLSVFLRKFNVPLREALKREGLLVPNATARLHVFFVHGTSVILGISHVHNASPWLMGIPRLRFPPGAPSRSTLKLDEAFGLFVRDPENEVQPGMTAVDLGAAPGGWTYQLVRRHLRTTAIDNGPMDASLLDSGLVEHLRVDGFRYRPLKPVDWLVCDMVEQPQRIARLVAEWLAEGRCRRAIFNLKLPMKKRYEMVLDCREILESRTEKAGVSCRLSFKQLYHDRAEITGYAEITSD